MADATVSTGETGATKRQQESAGPPAKRQQSDRVTINVGGTVFHTSEGTLAADSAYFSRLFAGRWHDATGAERFLDRDPDAFRVLLSCLRNRTVLLPEADPSLCTVVLLEAEFFGVEWLIQEVKARVSTNLGENFDELFPGGIAEAVSNGVLPARYFGPAPIPAPEPPKRKIVALQPISDYIVVAKPGGDLQTYDHHERHNAVALAVVQDLAGNTHVEPLVQQPYNDSRRDWCDEKQVVLASDLRVDGDKCEWRLKAAPKLMALPPNSVVAKVENEIRSVPFVQVTRVDPADDYYSDNREDLGTGGEFRFQFLDKDGDCATDDPSHLVQLELMGVPLRSD